MNRLRRATKCGKFSRAACWEFDVVLNTRQYMGNPKAKNYPSLLNRFKIYSNVFWMVIQLTG